MMPTSHDGPRSRDTAVEIMDAVLRCPRCGTHHSRVTTLARAEDAEFLIEVSTTEAKSAEGPSTTMVTLETSNADNPSHRRHGLSMVMVCESCHQRSTLTIAQHKGETEVRWKWQDPVPE